MNNERLPDSVLYKVPKRGEFDLDNLPIDDPPTWALFSRGDTIGVFQLEKKLGQDWSKKVKPDKLEDLASLISILRPGVLNSGAAEEYAQRKNGIKTVEYFHKSLEPILNDTYGCLLLQEQSMAIVRELAGFTETEADTLRAMLGKKQSEMVAPLRKQFIEGCKKVGKVTEQEAEEIFGWIEKGQRYIFNACFSGDTTIRRLGKYSKRASGYPVRHLYNIRNNISYAKQHNHLSLYKKWKRIGNYGNGLSLQQDGRIRPNVILDIRPSGIRPVYRITLENNYSVDVTDNHKFPTPNGEKKCSELKTGDYLFIQGDYEVNNKKYSFSNKQKTNQWKFYRTPKKAGFDNGPANPRYTDGGYTKFHYASKILPRECAVCGTKDGRLELHHIDGDRTNNELDNLQRLCASCHKKIEYSKGRTKIGEKGYPSILKKIVSIELIGEIDTYDVTMQGPDHNLSVNDGIIASNSHAFSYSKTSQKCGYIKCHYPTEFYCAWLTYADWKPDPFEERKILINDALIRGIITLPPDIRRKNVNFEIVEDHKIIFGLNHIRGVGSSAINAIKQLDNVDNFTNFLKAVRNIKRNVAEALVKSGACDCYNMSRTNMIRNIQAIYGRGINDEERPETRSLTPNEFNQFVDKLDSLGTIGALQSIINDKICVKKRIPTIESKIKYLSENIVDTARRKALWERLYLGISLSCSAADDVEKDPNAKTIKQLYSLANKQKCKLHCVIDSIKLRKTSEKSKTPGRDFAFVTVSDSTGSAEFTLWCENYDKYKQDLCEGVVISADVRKDNWKDREQVICNELEVIG